MGESSDEGEGLDPAARPIRLHPLFDPAVLGPTPCGQLGSSAAPELA